MSWVIEADGLSAYLRTRGGSAEVDLDSDGLTVRIEAGSGYMRENLDTYIPLEVLRELLAALERRGEAG
jgi:hypothetical protein